MRPLAGLLLVALTLYALADCARTPDARMRSLTKPLWVMSILLVPIVGPVCWLVAGDIRHRQDGPREPPGQ